MKSPAKLDAQDFLLFSSFVNCFNFTPATHVPSTTVFSVCAFSPRPDNHFLTSICSNLLLLYGQPSGAARAPKFFLHSYHASSNLKLKVLKQDRLALNPTQSRRPPLPTFLPHTTPEVGNRPSRCLSQTTSRCLPPSPTDNPCTPWQLEAWTIPSCKH